MTEYRYDAETGLETKWYDDVWSGVAFQLRVERPVAYGKDYFLKVYKNGLSPIAGEINSFRVQAMMRLCGEGIKDMSIVDVGCGAGFFVAACRVRGLNAYGYDINPFTEEMIGDWLVDKKDADVLTYFDSLEHVLDINAELVNRRAKFMLVSMPIFDRLEDIAKSKHFRPNEHLWYFSMEGFINLAEEFGWTMKFFDDTETRLGREGIMTFGMVRK